VGSLSFESSTPNLARALDLPMIWHLKYDVRDEEMAMTARRRWPAGA
jgi:hypothetical protein